MYAKPLFRAIFNEFVDIYATVNYTVPCHLLTDHWPCKSKA